MPNDDLRFGLIGVDSPHAVQFTRLFADGRVAGGRVASAWNAPTAADFPPGRRAEAHAEALPGLGVEVRESPDAVADDSDALLLVSADARTRRAQFEQVVGFGIPIYLDTRFSASPDETEAMLRLAAEHDTLVLSGSPKRFTPEFEAVADGGVTSAQIEGPIVEQPGHAGLAWYGVHLVDLAVAALGPGCRSVEPDGDGLRLIWDDRRFATIGGPAEWGPWTRGVVRTPEGTREFAIETGEDMLIGLLHSIVASCRAGIPNITAPEIREISAIVAAGSEAMARGGAVATRPS